LKDVLESHPILEEILWELYFEMEEEQLSSSRHENAQKTIQELRKKIG